MFGNEMSQQLAIVDTRNETVIDGLVDHIHHRIFEEAEIKDHLGLLARLVQRRASAGSFYSAPMPVNGFAFRSMGHHSVSVINTDASSNRKGHITLVVTGSKPCGRKASPPPQLMENMAAGQFRGGN